MKQVAKVLDHLSELPDLVKIIQIDGQTDAELVIGWAEFELGRRHSLTIRQRSTMPLPISAPTSWRL